MKGIAQQKIRHSLLTMKTGFEKEDTYLREVSFSFISLETSLPYCGQDVRIKEH